MRFNIYSTTVILMFAITVTFFGCERIERQQSVRTAKGEIHLGGTLRVPVKEFPKQLKPEELVGSDATEIGVHLFDGLVKLDPATSEVIPALAESWSVESDGLAYVFNLTSSVQFHQNKAFGNSSREITTADVIYSFEQLAQNAEESLFLSTVGNRINGAKAFRNGEVPTIEGVQVIDDYTIKLNLTKPDPSFLYILAQPSLGIIPEGLRDEEVVVGAGPFSLAELDEELVLVRNADYYLEDGFGNNYPYIDTLIFVEVGSNTEKLEAFFSGEIDVISNLELDPVRSILEQHVAEFSGKNPEYVMKRETENASYETYTIYRSGIKSLGSGFMGYQDFSRVQIEQEAQ